MRPGARTATSSAPADIPAAIASEETTTSAAEQVQPSQNVVSAFAIELAPAVRNAFVRDKQNNNGYVQHEALATSMQGVPGNGDPSSEASAQHRPLCPAEALADLGRSKASLDERIFSEAARVQAKFGAHVDTETRVVLRLTEHDTRVRARLDGHLSMLHSLPFFQKSLDSDSVVADVAAGDVTG